MPKQPENSWKWLAAIYPTFLNLRVKCLEGCLVLENCPLPQS